MRIGRKRAQCPVEKFDKVLMIIDVLKMYVFYKGGPRWALS